MRLDVRKQYSYFAVAFVHATTFHFRQAPQFSFLSLGETLWGLFQSYARAAHFYMRKGAKNVYAARECL